MVSTTSSSHSVSLSTTAEELRDRFERNRNEIARCLNLKELVPHLCEGAVLLSLEEGQAIVDISRARDGRTEILFSKIEQRGLERYTTFLTCLLKACEHLGHAYIAALLQGEEYASHSSVLRSREVKKTLVGHFSAFVKGINLTELVPHMYQAGLLTDDERDYTSDNRHSHTERVMYLFRALDSKGPSAYSLFAESLAAEHSHRAHSELHTLINGDLSSSKEQGSAAKKHTHDTQNTSDLKLSLCKRPSRRLKLHGPLKGREYEELMSSFQSFHHNGEWSRLEERAARYTTTDVSCELQAVALLEMAVRWIFQREEEKAVSCVSRAKEKSKLACGDNAVFLQGRCEYILSRLFCYLKQYSRAKEHAANAKRILFNVEPGEDSAFANYCDACVSVETLSEDSTLEEVKEVERCFMFAIDDARSHNSGLDLVAPHSFMRLAQMYLGSGHYVAGAVIRDSDSIRNAANCLRNVNVSTLSLRSSCHFRLIESDLLWNRGMLQESETAARCALDVSNTHNFTNEIVSAENRLRALEVL